MTEKSEKMPDNKAEKKARFKEVKKLLLSNIVTDENGELTVGGDFHINPQGPPDGALGTVMLGIASRETEYDTASMRNDKKVLYQAGEAMKKIGRIVKLPTVAEGHTVFLRHFFFRPVALIFEKKPDGRMVLTAYCGRALLTPFSMGRAIKLFSDAMPGKLLKLKNPVDKIGTF